MRQGKITTKQAIDILTRQGSIYWTEEGYRNNQVDWMLVAIFFNTTEIHTFCQGMVTRIYL